MDTRTASTEPQIDGRPSARRRWLLPAGVCLLVALLAQLPLIQDRTFYFSDDSAAVFLPTWHYMGTQLLHGHLPVLAPDLWMGGNIAAEAQLSLLNPIMMGNSVLTVWIGDLAVAADVIKTEFLVLLALGTYLLARDYGARRGPAAVVATALPFATFTLYFDAAGWAPGLFGFAFVPITWWAARRTARRALNPFIALLIAFLGMTIGSPYGALGVAGALLAVLIEEFVRHHRAGWLRLLWIIVLVGVTSLAVFVPLIGTASVTFRTNSGVTDTGYMVTRLGDLVNLSSPTYLPKLSVLQLHHLTVPYAYLAWFVLPLAPWLSWWRLRERLTERFGILLFAIGSLLFTTGPSTMWLFRWPMRTIEYFFIPVSLMVALVLSGGIQRSRPGLRIAGSAALLFSQLYLAWAVRPDKVQWHLIATVVLAVLLTAVVSGAGRDPRWVAPLLTAGTVVVLGMQLVLYPSNAAATAWRFPHNVGELQNRFAERYPGDTIAVATVRWDDPANYPDGRWRDLLFGSMWPVAGVTALNSYTGLGYTKFSNITCMKASGGTCGRLYDRLWNVEPTTRTQYADLFRLRNVVVQNGLPRRPVTDPPPGWSIAERNDRVTVLRRDRGVPWPNGHVSATTPGLTIANDTAGPPGSEDITYAGGGTITLAMLAWPGWRATVDGHELPVRQGPAGLIQLDLPSSGQRVHLSFTPPGWSWAIPAMWGGLLIGLLWGLSSAAGSSRRFAELLRRRRPRDASQAR